MDGRRGSVMCHLRKGGDRRTDEMKVLSGVEYMTKTGWLRTEPWGTLQRQVCIERRGCYCI